MTTIRKRRLVVPFLALALAGAIGAAPAAMADGSNCRDSGGVRKCAKNGHSSIRVTPAPRPSAGGGLFNPAYVPGFGEGLPVAPILG